MSSNLYKGIFTVLNEDEKRVIDSDALIEKKLSQIAQTVKSSDRMEPKPADGDGFSEGLSAQILDGLLSDEEGEAEAEEAQKELSAAQLREEAYLEIEQMKAEAEQQLEEERQRVLADAQKQGLQEGRTKGQQEFDAKNKQLADKAAELDRQFEEMVRQLEPHFVETLTDIYEHVLGVDLSADRDIVIHLVEKALCRIEGGKSYIVRVSRDDYPYVSMQKKQIAAQGAAGAAVEIVEDATLLKNQAMIETDGGIFDCSLGTQLAELSRKLRLLSYEGHAEG